VDHSRRVFVVSASAWAGLTLLGCPRAENAAPNKPENPPTYKPEPEGPAPTNRGVLIGPGSRNKERDAFLSFVNLDQLEKYASGALKPSLLALAFPGHAVVPHPVQRNLAAVFQKWGPGACEVDLVENRVTREITTVAEREFYGHGAWATDGSLLYTVESTPVKDGPYDGVIAVRDGKTLEITGEFPTFGKAPHDCHLLDDGKTLGITNGGDEFEPGCVTYVDIETRSLLERVNIPTLMAGHMAVTGRSSKGDLAVGSTPRNPKGAEPEAFKKIPGGLALRSGKGEAVLMSSPTEITQKMLGETLSVVIHEGRGIVGATTPAGGIVTFWDIRQGTLLKSYELPIARGIALTLNQEYFVITWGFKTEVSLVRVSDLSMPENLRLGAETPSGISGSHTIIYDM
jgi:uncharacterized protein